MGGQGCSDLEQRELTKRIRRDGHVLIVESCYYDTLVKSSTEFMIFILVPLAGLVVLGNPLSPSGSLYTFSGIILVYGTHLGVTQS